MQAGNGLHLHFSFVDINSADPKRNAFGNADNLGGISAKGKHFMVILTSCFFVNFAFAFC